MASVNQPLLPSHLYKDEKEAVSPRSSIESFDESSTPLRLGGPPTYYSRVKDRVSGLSKTKKILGVGALALLGLHFAGHSVGGRHHRGRFGCNKHGAQSWGWKTDPQTITPAEYASSIALPSSELLEGIDLFTANATFPIDLDKEISLDLFQGVNGRIVISRSGFFTEVPEAQVVVESIWSGDAGAGEVQLASNKWTDAVSIAASDSPSHHTIHLILPPSLESLPSLHLTSDSALAVTLHPSASDLTFNSFSLKTENGDIDLPLMVGKHVKVETITGSVSGSFNVSKKLILKALVGDITANITVKPHFGFHPPHNGSFPHRNGTHHGIPKWHKGKKGSKGDEDEHPSNDRHEREKGSPWWPFTRGRGHYHEVEKFDGEDMEGEWKVLEIPSEESLTEIVEGDEEIDEEDGKKEKKPHGPPNGPKHKPHHGPPKPVFIGAFTTTGNVTLNIARQPPFVSSVIKAISNVGSVKIHHARSFKGLFEAGTFVGKVTVATGGPKEIKLFKEVVTGSGGFVVGAVKFPHGYHNHTRNAMEVDVQGWYDLEKESMEGEKEERGWRHWKFFGFPGGNGGEKGPDGPDGPRPPHKGPGGPPPPPHKGPGGPPPPPHKGPGGPPHKGPGGPPHPPPKGPKGPHGPEHAHHPPPPGHSKVIAKTKVGTVNLFL